MLLENEPRCVDTNARGEEGSQSINGYEKARCESDGRPDQQTRKPVVQTPEACVRGGLTSPLPRQIPGEFDYDFASVVGFLLAGRGRGLRPDTFSASAGIGESLSDNIPPAGKRFSSISFT